jgi:hypothetical protein
MLSNWEASRAMNAELASEYGIHLGRLAEVEALFAPAEGCPRFAAWHAVCLRPGADPEFKIYLNPQASGRAGARRLTESAMRRLGLGDAVASLPPTGPDDELWYFSLDLAAREGARVKVYTAHHRATAARIERAVSTVRAYVPGQATAFCSAMAESEGPYSARPVATCLSFVVGCSTPTTGTVHFPVRTYATDDLAVRDRVVRYLNPAGARVYRRAIDAFADRRLEDGVGMQTYAALRLTHGPEHLTVYLAPEVYDIGQIAITVPTVSGVVGRGALPAWPAAVGEQK